MSDSYIALVEKSIDERTQQYQELLQLRVEKENLQKELFNYKHHSEQRLIALREAEGELREEKETAARLRANNESLREALRSIFSMPAKPLHLTRDYIIRLPEHVLFEAAHVFELSCQEAMRDLLGVTKKGGSGK